MVLVQDEHGFQKGAPCAPPPGRRSSKKSLAWIVLTVDEVYRVPQQFSRQAHNSSKFGIPLPYEQSTKKVTLLMEGFF